MDKKITLRHLEAFRAMMLRRSVTAAAQSLEVTQPVVTRLIAEFEARIGVTLFERVNSRLRPTSEATLLLEDVHQSLMSIERIRNASENVRLRRMQRLEIAAAPAMATSFLPGAIAKFSAQYPETLVTLHMQASPTALDMVQAERCDVGFVMLSPDHTRFKGLETLVVGKLVVAVPAGHRLARKSTLSPPDFVDEPLISLPTMLETTTKLDSLFLSHRVQRRVNIETQISYAAIKLVEAGAGLAIIDPLTACSYRGQEVKFVLFEPAVPCEYSMVVSNRHASTLVLKPFIDLARAQVKELLPRKWMFRNKDAAGKAE
jgi:DNA-binding transcriptional LysR family regulator